MNHHSIPNAMMGRYYNTKKHLEMTFIQLILSSNNKRVLQLYYEQFPVLKDKRISMQSDPLSQEINKKDSWFVVDPLISI